MATTGRPAYADINEAICRALDIDPTYTTEVRITLRANEPPTVEVTQYVQPFTVVEDRLVTTLSRYRLVEEEGS